MNKERNIWKLMASIVKLVIGIAAIISYIIVINNAQIVHLLKWRITLILSVGFVIGGSVGIVDWVKQFYQIRCEADGIVFPPKRITDETVVLLSRK